MQFIGPMEAMGDDMDRERDGTDEGERVREGGNMEDVGAD